MKHILFKTIIAILFANIFCTLIVQADSVNSNYKITKVPNIPQNEVQCLFQDSRSFMWMGTLDGLHRYDGYNYKSYRTSDDLNSINSNLILDISEDSKGHIWIATYDKGICMLDPKKEKWTDYSSILMYDETSPMYDVNKMYIDRNDVMWLVHKHNLIRVFFNEDMEAVTQITILKSFKTAPQAILLDERGQLWISGDNSILRVPNPYADSKYLSVESFQGIAFHFQETENGIIAIGNGLYTIIRTDNDEIGKQYEFRNNYITYGYNILYQDGYVWTANRHGISCYEYDGKHKFKRDFGFEGNFNILELGCNSITSMIYDPVSGIWIGTRGSGVNRINLNPQRFMRYNNNKSQPNSLRDNFIRCVFQDSYEQVWIGTEEGGANIARKCNSHTFSNGIENVNIKESMYNAVYCVEEIPTPKSDKYESLILLGTSYPNGIAGVNPHTLEDVALDTELFQVGNAFTMEVYDSMLWIGTYENGLWRFIIDEKGDVTSSHQFLPEDYDGSVNSNIIRYLLRDSKSNLWVGTDKGIMRIRPNEVSKEQPKFENYSSQTSNKRFGFDYILQIYEDKEGRIWVGTMGGGLLCYNQETSNGDVSFVNITMKDGLPNNTIKSIVEDEDGNLWLATNEGISKYNIANRGITNYDKYDGLQGNEFSEICGLKLKDGNIIMGGVNGFNIFNPNDIFVDDTPVRCYITEFYIDNKKVQPNQKLNGRVVLENSISYTEKIKLKHSENSFGFSFVGVNYNSAKKNNYKYKLEGFDKEWISTNLHSRVANYTNIPSGRYTFKVMSSSSDNKQIGELIELSVRVLPPFYICWVAILVYIIIVFIAIILFIRYRKKEMAEKQLKMKEKIEKEQSEELSLMRQQFFTNVSHEFKTPLTLIKGPIERLINNPELPENAKIESYKLINQNVRIMMRLVSQLMDFRKLDQDKMELKYSRVNVNDFVYSIYKSFESWASQKDLSFDFIGVPSGLETSFDTEKMEVVVYNIISNAIKNTPNKGSVQIKIQEITDDGEFAIIVSDTGVGISLIDQEHIFERFFQSKDSKKRSNGGTGIGLAHSKALVEKMNGLISFESEEGVGTTFFIHMPLENKVAETEIVHEPTSDLHIEENIDIDREKSTQQDEQTNVNILSDKQTILMVDDNYDLRHFIADEFSDEYNVLLAEDGVDGLAKAIKYNPDIIITDVMMPNMDGIEMCRRVKTEESISHIPVIILTSKVSNEAQKEGFSNGADAYVAKPFSTDVLRLRIRSILKSREMIKDRFQKEIKINPMVISNSNADVKFMESILKLIEDNLSDPDFNVDKLAKAYGVSRVYLSKKIKSLTGESTIQFQRMVKLKHAAELLLQDSLSVSEVAWEVGYNDLNTFRQRFKEKFDMSPSEYRQSKGKKEEENS